MLPRVVIDFPSNGSIDIDINQVGNLCSFHRLLKGHRSDCGMLSQPPVVNLLSCETSTMDSRLLSGPDSNHLAILCVANRVGLGVLQCNCGHNQVSHGFGRKLLRIKGINKRHERIMKVNLQLCFWRQYL